MLALLVVALLFASDQDGARLAEADLRQLLAVKRVYVDRLGGGETAAQIRDMIIAGLHSSRLFIITENAERADAFLRGSAEDLVYTDTLSSSEGVNVRAGASSSDGARTTAGRSSRSASVSLGDQESVRIADRKHEATASVRLVNKDGDVIWSATEESTGAKFRGAAADVS
ncbi:MAG TPA: hypothetical protein VN428_20220, partial [Bryobacteraceae bacterium]|nr:hypothetical protein [Bryobacteraceae bacterium]